MAFTGHGHQVPGSDWTDPPFNITPCGGLTKCKACRRDARMWTDNHPAQLFKEV